MGGVDVRLVRHTQFTSLAIGSVMLAFLCLLARESLGG
jgi:hypothetical protein